MISGDRRIPPNPFVVMVRGLVLALLPLLAGHGGRLSPLLSVLLAVWASLMLAGGWVWLRRGLSRGQLWILIAVDALLACAVLAASGADEPSLWAALVVPGMTAGPTLGRRAGWLASGIAALAGWGTSQVAAPGGALIPGLLSSLGVLLASGMLGEVLRRWGTPEAPRETTTSPHVGEASLDRVAEAYRSAAGLTVLSTREQILDRALDLCGEAVGQSPGAEERMVSAVLLPAGSGYQMAAARRLSAADRRRPATILSGILGDTVRDHVARTTDQPALDPGLAHWEGFRGCGSALTLPLDVPEGQGLLVFGHARAGFFDIRRTAALDAIAIQAQALVQNLARARELAQERDRITELEEAARKRMARDLHDGPTQVMASIAMRANYARRLIPRDRKAAVEELDKLEEMARRTTKEIRQMLFTMRPLILESQGLVAALAQLADKVHDTHGENVLVDAAPEAAEGIDPAVQGVVFYVAEEAINNARKHAAAQHIWVRLERHGGVLILEVRDDGVGFNVGAVDADYAQRGSLGMVNMRERAELIGGRLHLDSAEGRGTTVMLSVPVGAPRQGETPAPVGQRRTD